MLIFSGRIYKEANRLGNLVADIIQLSRLDEQQDAVVSMESVELDELAKDVVNNLRDHAEKKNISLDYCGIPINIQGVRHVLYEMLYNIADNAVRYTNPGGHIHIYVGRKGIVLFTGLRMMESEFQNLNRKEYLRDFTGWTKAIRGRPEELVLDCPL